MKKTLAAVAVLGAFAGSALAANVTLYGVVDTGLQYNHIDYDKTETADVDKLSMESGQQAGSRFGLKGTEDLGNGLTVGFILENQFNSDDGALKSTNTLFHREASLFLQGGFGKLAFGRIGSINQGTGSFAKIGALSPFGTSYSNLSVTNLFAGDTIRNNMIAYETPDFAGFKVFAQYGMGDTKTEDKSNADPTKWTAKQVENESSTDRYYAIGATYNNGPLAAYLSVDSINYKSYTTKWTTTTSGGTYTASDVDDSLTVTLGGSYDFEVVKAYIGVQYFDEVKGKLIGYTDGYDKKVKGYAVTLGASAPVVGGTAMFSVGYSDAENADSVSTDFDLTRWVVGAGYNYPLSKRTNVYGAVSYMQDKLDPKGGTEEEPSQVQVMVGLRHNF